jgi:heat shock protein HslJ
MVEKQISSYHRPAARWIRWVVKGGDGKHLALAIIALPLAALLVACATGSQGTAPPGTPIPLTGTKWMLTSLDGSSPVEGAAATLAFYPDNYMEGTSGCNSFGTDYATQDGEFRIAEIHRTASNCEAPPDIMRQDRAFFEALAGIAAYRATEDRLEFDGATGKTVLAYARKRPAAVDPALRDTEWVLTQLDGRDLLPGSHIQLHLGPEGFGGFAGCNSYGGQYEAASGGILQFGEWGITAMACSSPPGVMEQEQEYIDALRQAAWRTAASRSRMRPGRRCSSLSSKKRWKATPPI